VNAKEQRRAEERLSKFRAHAAEERQRKAKFERLEAPFRKARPCAAAAAPKPSDDALTGSDVDDPPAKMKLQVKVVTKRPGKVRKRAEEVQQLRDVMAQRCAQLRAEQKAVQQLGIHIGKVDVAPEAPPESESPPVPKPADPPPASEEEEEEPAAAAPLKNLDDLMRLPSDDSDEQTNDYLSLAAIAQNIFDHPPSDSEDAEEAEPEPLPPMWYSASARLFVPGSHVLLPSVGMIRTIFGSPGAMDAFQFADSLLEYRDSPRAVDERTDVPGLAHVGNDNGTDQTTLISPHQLINFVKLKILNIVNIFIKLFQLFDFVFSLRPAFDTIPSNTVGQPGEPLDGQHTETAPLLHLTLMEHVLLLQNAESDVNLVDNVPTLLHCCIQPLWSTSFFFNTRRGTLSW
jgi:hypothetical protein